MNALAIWRGTAVVGSVAGLFIATVAMTPGAAASGSLRGCPNKVISYVTPGVYGGKMTYKEHVKSISVQGVSCAAADKVIKGDFTTQTGKVGAYKCQVAKFKVPVGYFPIACTRSGSKIQFARHGG
jgi:hypothetical protein